MLIFCALGSAQDVHFSQQFDNDIYLNPAQSGLGQKANRFVFQYRDQWRSVPVPYASAFLSYDRRIDVGKRNAIGAGVQLLYDRAGEGSLSTVKVAFAPSYIKYLKDNKSSVSLGLQVGFINRFIDEKKLIFESQFDGNTIDNPSGESFAGSAFALDLGAGLHFDLRLGERDNRLAFGFSTYNLNQPNVAFGEDEDKRPIRYNVYAQSEIFVGNNGWSLNPVLEFQRQAKENNVLPLLYAKKYFQNEKRTAISFGGGYRLNDAAKIYFAFEILDFKIGLNYDVNTSSFRSATNTVGAGEILLKYQFERKKTPTIIDVTLDTILVEDFAEELIEQINEQNIDSIDTTEIEEDFAIDETTPPIEGSIDIVTDSIKEEVGPASIPRTPEIDAINKGQTIALYFPNDYPNPNSRSATTTATYEEVYDTYLKMGAEYQKLGGEEGQMQQFINEHVVSEWNKFNLLVEDMANLLADGKSITLIVKGYTSPISSPDYNLILSKRRVQSIKNQISSTASLRDYLNSGQLKIVEAYFGESQSDQSISDDRSDRKHSVYTDKASFERKVVIEQVIVE